MSWHLLEKIFDEVTKQSTFIGRIWITLLFVFRIIAITRMGDTVYADEQTAFRCNTKEPGCENVCFNAFSPISHVRFWGFQIIITATPAMMFMVYSAHCVSRIPGSCKLNGRKVHFPKKDSEKRKKGSLKLQSSSTNAEKHLTNDIMISAPYPKHHINPSAPVAEIGINGVYCHENDYKEFLQDNPPAYNEYTSNAIREINSENMVMSRNYDCNENNTNYSSNDQLSCGVYPKLTAPYKSVPFDYLRRYSDGYPSVREKHGAVIRKFSSRTGSSSAAKSLHCSRRLEDPAESDAAKSNAKWCEHKLPMTLIHLTPKSDRDSAFYEKATSYDTFQSKSNFVSPYASAYKLVTKVPSLSQRGSKSESLYRKNMSLQSLISQRHKASMLEEQVSKSKTSSLKQLQPTLNTTKSLNKCISSNSAATVNTNDPAKNAIKLVERKIGIAYLVHCFFRMNFEIAFMLLQYFLFEFEVPELYKCQRWPCPNTVDCFVSRPREKSMMLYFMFGVAAICIAMSCVEILRLLWKRAKDFKERRNKKKNAKRRRDVEAVKIQSHSRIKDKELEVPRQNYKYDVLKHPYLLEGNNKYKVRRRSIEISESDSTDSKSSRKTLSETDSEDAEESSFDSDMSLLEAEMEEALEYENDQNEQPEFA